MAGQQGKPRPELFADVPDDAGVERLQRLVALLRIAVAFKYVDDLAALPDLGMKASNKTLELTLPEDWLVRHPLTKRELEQQKEALRKLDLRLHYT